MSVNDAYIQKRRDRYTIFTIHLFLTHMPDQRSTFQKFKTNVLSVHSITQSQHTNNHNNNFFLSLVEMFILKFQRTI